MQNRDREQNMFMLWHNLGRLENFNFFGRGGLVLGDPGLVFDQ